MASPLNKLQSSFRQGTQLGSTSLQETSARMGQPVRPTSPFGAAGIGVGPDSAKMAGSSANLAAAQRQALQPSETERLQDVLRRRSLQRGETTEEKTKREQAQKLGGLTSLQGRVQELMDAQLNTISSTTAAQALPLITPASVGKIHPELSVAQRNRLAEILQDISDGTAPAGQTMADAYIEAYEILGIKGTDKGTKKTITDLIAASTQSIGEAAAAGIGNNLIVTEASLQQMGTSSAELAPILGMTPDELLKLSTDELVLRVNNTRQSQFSTVESLRRIVSDPNVGAAERQAAQEQLVALGYAGVSSTEAGVQRLTDEIEDANTVTVGGKTISVSEALSDKFISGFIKTYLEGDMATRDEMADKYKNLVTFINQNKDALQDLANNLDTSITDFFTMQDNARKMGKVAGGNTLNDDVMKDWGLPTSTNTAFVSALPAPPPILNYLDSPTTDPAQVQTITQSLNNIAALDATDYGGVMTSIRESSEQELKDVGFTDNSNIYSDYVTTIRLVNNADTDQGILSAIFGDMDYQSITNELEAIRSYQKLGLLKDVDPIIDILDANKDGKIDKASDIKAAFLNMTGKDGRPLTVKEILQAGKKVNDKGLNPAELRKRFLELKRRVDGSDTTTPGIQFKEFFKDGVFDAKDIASLEAKGLDFNTKISTIEKLMATNVPGTESLKAVLDQAVDSRATELLDSISPNIRGGAKSAVVSWNSASRETWTAARKAYQQLINQGGLPRPLVNKLQEELNSIQSNISKAATEEYNKKKAEEEKRLDLPKALQTYNSNIAKMQEQMAIIGLPDSARGTPEEEAIINDYLYRRTPPGQRMKAREIINAYRSWQEQAIAAERIVETKNNAMNGRLAPLVAEAAALGVTF